MLFRHDGDWLAMGIAAALIGIASGAGFGIIGLFVMTQGVTAVGVALLAFGLVIAVFSAGAGLPRPRVVPRPGEEGEYP